MEEIISEIRKIYDNNKELKEKVEKYESELKEFKNMTENLKNKNIELEIKVRDLEEKNNFKSSKLIWENTQNIIKEKDNEIDKLKKKYFIFRKTRSY
jgi:cell division septum initiation protein DivIVA